MKKWIPGALALLMLAGPATALRADCEMCAHDGGMKMDPAKKADHMAVMLDLSDKQKAEVQKLMEAKQQRMKPAMDEMQKTMKAAHEEFDAGLQKILNDKQKKKYEAMKDMHGDKGAGGHKMGH